MSSAVLSLGSNVGDRAAILAEAVRALDGSVRAVSSVYRTSPWGPVAQDDFYNLVVLADDVDAGPEDWLQRCRALEAAAGRRRTVRWGPRTLDADVISVDGVRSSDADLTLPHPRAGERAFVLVPWSEVDPDAVLPGLGTVTGLLARLPAAEVAAVRVIGRV